uniref:Uncharacterized protein n=1 Tax=Xenopus tropicalis TaxID=8364 RepID=A0A6I8RIJ5_XENTR
TKATIQVSLLTLHILDVWVIVLIILATILVMASLLLFPTAAVVMYRVWTHPIRSTSLNGL